MTPKPQPPERPTPWLDGLQITLGSLMGLSAIATSFYPWLEVVCAWLIGGTFLVSLIGYYRRH